MQKAEKQCDQAGKSAHNSEIWWQQTNLNGSVNDILSYRIAGTFERQNRKYMYSHGKLLKIFFLKEKYHIKEITSQRLEIQYLH